MRIEGHQLRCCPNELGEIHTARLRKVDIAHEKQRVRAAHRGHESLRGGPRHDPVAVLLEDHLEQRAHDGFVVDDHDRTAVRAADLVKQRERVENGACGLGVRVEDPLARRRCVKIVGARTEQEHARHAVDEASPAQRLVERDDSGRRFLRNGSGELGAGHAFDARSACHPSAISPEAISSERPTSRSRALPRFPQMNRCRSRVRVIRATIARTAQRQHCDARRRDDGSSSHRVASGFHRSGKTARFLESDAAGRAVNPMQFAAVRSAGEPLWGRSQAALRGARMQRRCSPPPMRSVPASPQGRYRDRT